MDTKEMFSIILDEIRESRVEMNKRFDNLEAKMDRLLSKTDKPEGRIENLEPEVMTTKQQLQNFEWDIEFLADKQAKTEMAINRLEKRFET